MGIIYKPENIVASQATAVAFCNKLRKEVSEAYESAPVKCGTVCWGYAHLAAVRVSRQQLGVGVSDRVPPDFNEVLKKVVSATEWYLGTYVEPSVGEQRLIDEFFKYELPDWLREKLPGLCRAKQVPIASPAHRKARKVTHKEFVGAVRGCWHAGTSFVNGAWHITVKENEFSPGMVDGAFMDANYYLDRRFESAGSIATLHKELLAAGNGLVLVNRVGAETLVPMAVPIPCDSQYGVAWIFSHVPTTEWAPMLDISL